MKFYSRFVKISKVGQTIKKNTIFCPNFPIFGKKKKKFRRRVKAKDFLGGGGVKAKHPLPPHTGIMHANKKYLKWLLPIFDP